MDKRSKIMMAVWMVLAIAAFVSSFYCPIVPMIIGLCFGSMNIGVILALIAALIEGRKEYKKQKVESDGMSM